MEGRLVPVPDAGLPRARAPRRDVRHRRRSLRDRILARDEPGRASRAWPKKPASRWSIVCGHNMGDIFRRNSFNLGLHVVQSPEAVADAQDGDEFTFDPSTRASCATRRRDRPTRRCRCPPKEEEIRRGGGIFAVGRREFPASVRRDAGDRLAGRRAAPPDDDDRADRLGAPGRQGRSRPSRLKPGDDAARLRRSAAGVGRHGAVRDPHLQPDHRRQHDRPAPGGDCQRSLRVHRRRRRRQADEHRPRVRAASTASRSRTTRRPATASSISTFPEQGLVMPGQFIPGADSHSRAYGAYGAVGHRRRLDDARVRMVDGYIYFTLARQRRVRFEGRLQPWVSGKDIVLELLRRWGAKQSQGMSVELVDAARAAADCLSQHHRQHDGGGRSAERHLRARTRSRYDWYRQKGIATLPYPRIAPGADARVRDRRSSRSDRRAADDRQAVQPGQRVSGRGGRARAHHVRQGDDRIVHQRQLRRSAAGGAGAARGARLAVRARSSARSRSFRDPAASAVRSRRPDPRLGGESIAEVFRSVGGEIRRSWCGPCFGQGPDALTPGQRAITSFNRNWQNRMGVGGGGISRQPRRRCGVRARGLHGAAERARAGVGSGNRSACSPEFTWWRRRQPVARGLQTPPCTGLKARPHVSAYTRRAESQEIRPR